MKQKATVPVWEKVNLTILEASQLFGIGETRMRALAKEPNDFTLMVGSKVLIRRTQFEKWLQTRYVL